MVGVHGLLAVVGEVAVDAFAGQQHFQHFYVGNGVIDEQEHALAKDHGRVTLSSESAGRVGGWGLG